MQGARKQKNSSKPPRIITPLYWHSFPNTQTQEINSLLTATDLAHRFEASDVNRWDPSTLSLSGLLSAERLDIWTTEYFPLPGAVTLMMPSIFLRTLGGTVKFRRPGGASG